MYKVTNILEMRMREPGSGASAYATDYNEENNQRTFYSRQNTAVLELCLASLRLHILMHPVVCANTYCSFREQPHRLHVDWQTETLLMLMQYLLAPRFQYMNYRVLIAGLNNKVGLPSTYIHRPMLFPQVGKVSGRGIISTILMLH